MDTVTYPLKLAAATLFRNIAVRTKPNPKPDVVENIPSRDSNRTIIANVYKSSTPSNGPSPVLLTWHGSGFLLPLHGSDDFYARYIASNTPYTVLDLAYRLAPENPHPAAIHDVEDAVKYVLSHPELYDLKQVSIGGFSAGACLALAVCPMFPKGTFQALVAFYPPTDLTIGSWERKAPKPEGNPLPPLVTFLFNSCYVPYGHDMADPRLSPVNVNDDAFPERMMFVTCSYDSLCDEAEVLKDRLKKVKKDVRHMRVDTDHAWNVMPLEKGSHGEKARDQTYDFTRRFLLEK